jgi:hypothetical protein
MSENRKKKYSFEELLEKMNSKECAVSAKENNFF